MKELNIISTVVGRKIDSLNVPSKQGASVDLTAYLLKKIWDEAFEVKTDANGNQYLFGKLPLATQYGITMYVDGGTLDLPSIFDGLPIDSVTLYWEETELEDGTISKILKSKSAGTLGALENVGEWADEIPEEDRIMVQKAGSNLWESLLLSKVGSASFENISESGEGNAFTSFVLSEDKLSLELVKGETFATKTEFDTLNTKVTDFLEGSDTDTIINKWKELEAFLSGMSESDDLATILSNKADKGTTLADYGITDAYSKDEITTELLKYVTLGTSQTITGSKNFTGGVAVNGGVLYYNSTSGYWKLEGDLIVTGGITMFASDTAFTPSTIMDALLLDENTLKLDESGQLTVIGGGGGAIENPLTLQANGTTIATFDGSEAVTANFNYSNLGLDNRYVLKDGTGATGTWDISISGNADSLDGLHANDFYKNEGGVISSTSDVADLNAGSYFVTSSLGQSNPVPIDYSSLSVLGNSYYSSQLCVTHNATRAWLRGIYNKTDSATASDWHELAFVDSNVASATSLKTPRYIWGQPFDGTSNIDGLMIVNGNATFSGNVGIGTTSPSHKLDVDGTIQGFNLKSSNICIECDADGNRGSCSSEINHFTGNLYIQQKTNGSVFLAGGGGNVGIGTTYAQYRLHVNGTMYGDLHMATARTIWGQSFDGTSNIDGLMTVNGNATFSGNVGVGTTSPSHKLDVDGTIQGFNLKSSNICIECDADGNRGSCSSEINHFTGNLYIQQKTNGSVFLAGGGGNVGIGTTSASAKLHVSGNILATGGITMYSDITKKNIIQEKTISLDKIANAPSFLYIFKDDDKGLVHLGSSAQYWQGINEHFVKDNDGVLSMGYGNIALTCAISIARELERYESKTDKQIKKLKKRICELEEQVEQLKAS